jgi:hypothetical protein
MRLGTRFDTAYVVVSGGGWPFGIVVLVVATMIPRS